MHMPADVTFYAPGQRVKYGVSLQPLVPRKDQPLPSTPVQETWMILMRRHWLFGQTKPIKN